MNGSGAGGPNVPVVKVGLKRINLGDRVFEDEELRDCALVKSLGEPATRALLAQGTGRRFATQARLFLEGDASDSLFFILKGEARIYVGAGTDTVEVTVARKGDVLGEREALGDSTARSFSAQAASELEVVEFSADIIRAAATKCAELARHLRSLGEARKTASAEMADFFNRW